MLYTEDFSMRHYVRFSQIRSQLSVVITCSQYKIAISLDTLPEVGQRWFGRKGLPPVARFIFPWPDNFVACFQEFIKILGKDVTYKIRYPQAFRLGGWQAKECIITILAWSPVHPNKPYHHQLPYKSPTT